MSSCFVCCGLFVDKNLADKLWAEMNLPLHLGLARHFLLSFDASAALPWPGAPLFALNQRCSGAKPRNAMAVRTILSKLYKSNVRVYCLRTVKAAFSKGGPAACYQKNIKKWRLARGSRRRLIKEHQKVARRVIYNPGMQELSECTEQLKQIAKEQQQMHEV